MVINKSYNAILNIAQYFFNREVVERNINQHKKYKITEVSGISVGIT